MLSYQTTAMDLEAGLGGVYQATVVPAPVKSSGGWIWKTVATISILCLCALASVFFTLHVMKPTEEKQEFQIYHGKQTDLPSEQARVLKRISESTKAAIHLHATSSNSQSTVTWIGDVDQSFVQGGLKLENNEIHIPANGLYFVYSQVSYDIECKADEQDDDDDDDDSHVDHTVMIRSKAVGNDDKMPLQSSTQSVCQEKGERTYTTIYLGAVFKLLKGDKLSTQTSHVAEIESHYSKTFFGVFAL